MMKREKSEHEVGKQRLYIQQRPGQAQCWAVVWVNYSFQHPHTTTHALAHLSIVRGQITDHAASRIGSRMSLL